MGPQNEDRTVSVCITRPGALDPEPITHETRHIMDGVATAVVDLSRIGLQWRAYVRLC